MTYRSVCAVLCNEKKVATYGFAVMRGSRNSDWLRTRASRFVFDPFINRGLMKLLYEGCAVLTA